MKTRTWAAALAASALVLAACGSDDEDDADDTTEAGDSTEAEEPVDARADWPDELVLTLTPSSEAQALIDDAGPLAAVLEERLGIPVDHFVPTDYAGVLVALESGQTHVAGGLGPQQMVQAADQVGAELILQSVRFGESVYVTQWFTNDPDTYCAAEPVNVPFEEDGDEYDMLFCNGVDTATASDDGPFGEDAIAEVVGQRIAFVDQGSASGHLVPSVQLFNAGIDPQADVDEIYAGGHDNSVLAVYRGDADVGVSFNDAREIVVDQAEDVGEEVVVFGWSFPIPNDGFAVGPGLPEDLTTEITAALTDFAATEEGQETLGDLYNIDDLVEINDTGVFDPIRTLIRDLGDLLDD